jgi:hypothetical protein
MNAQRMYLNKLKGSWRSLPIHAKHNFNAHYIEDRVFVYYLPTCKYMKTYSEVHID